MAPFTLVYARPVNICATDPAVCVLPVCAARPARLRGQLDPSVQKRLDDRWASTVAAATGLKSYDDLRARVESENRRRAL